jgi:hypothetical protein
VEYSFLCNTLYHPFQPENRNEPIFVIGQSSSCVPFNDNNYDGNSGKAVETLLNYSNMGFILVPSAWDGNILVVISTLGPLCLCVRHRLVGGCLFATADSNSL